MKKGLVFGKFMPVHQGHLELIAFAKSYCDELIVSMSFTANDPINPELRFEWLKSIFKDRQDVKLVKYLDDFNDDNLPIFEATKLWADFIKREFPDIEVFFCSESYGKPLSFHLKIPCIIFDEHRNTIPISATKIRANPLKYWNYIPQEVRGFYTKKICLFGPESVGKTMLSQKLAEYFNTTFVHEAARDILQSNEEIDEQKLIEIGERQTSLVKEKAQLSNKILFCDTDLITTQIYAKHYLDYVPNRLYELEKEINYEFYFLLNIDIEWVFDPLRDLKSRRKEMYEIFKNELEKRNINYIEIDGNWENRFQLMVQKIESIFPKLSEIEQ